MRRGQLRYVKPPEPEPPGGWRLAAADPALLEARPALCRALLLAGDPLAWQLAPPERAAELQRPKGRV